MIYRKLPMGVQDVLPDECELLNAVREKLQSRFALGGFRPVLSGALEYFDTYSQIASSVPQERMFKLTDTDGKLLVLRPDATLAIARIAATKLSGEPARLCYFADKWDLQNAGGISSREIYQAGVECLGEEGALSDAQAIAFAIECMKETGLCGFVVDIGHVGYFKGLLEECGLSEEDAESVRRFINAKDGFNAERVLRSAGVKEDTLNTVLALPTLFGGAEVLDRAETLTENAVARGAIAHLKKVYAILKGMGYDDCLCFDLGTVRRLSYYTGIVFSGMVQELGAPILSGGRYDNLADNFGKHIPAVGFAIGLKRVLIALERQKRLPAKSKTDVAIACAEGAEGEAYSLYLQCVSDGKRAVFLPEYGTQALQNYQADERLFVEKSGVKRV